MRDVVHGTHSSEASPQAPQSGAPRAPRGRAALVPAGLALAIAALTLLPRVAPHPTLRWTLVGVAAAIAAWTAILWTSGRGRGFAIEYRPVRSHYVQAAVQVPIYLYWGWYWRDVFDQVPLIAAQMFALYALDALFSWSRGRTWRAGFGPLPIILSTNLFLWFVDDWFYLQFVLILLGALGKQFITWTRDGQRTHVFNPSAFGLFLVSIVLIATESTGITRGVEIAATLGRPPHIFLLIFGLGLVVQSMFAVTLLTFSAAATLYLMNVVYTQVTGVYQFLDESIPIAVFLGFHLLMTDPSTTPRTNAGRVIFGILYGAATFFLYDVLNALNAPEFYDKLLPVPILNLCVPLIERFTRNGPIGRLTAWEARRSAWRLNAAHMAAWIALFGTMYGTKFIAAPHPGASIAFWKKAHAEGRHHADWKYVRLVRARADGGSPQAAAELGLLHMQGELVPHDPAAAAHWFARACELGEPSGCANVARQFLFRREARSAADVERAFARLEAERGQGGDPRSNYLLGYAHETGRGVQRDPVRAAQLYREGAARRHVDSSAALVRLVRTDRADGLGAADALPALSEACAAGHAECCELLAALHGGGLGVAPDPIQVRACLERACRLGLERACLALRQAER